MLKCGMFAHVNTSCTNPQRAVCDEMQQISSLLTLYLSWCFTVLVLVLVLAGS